MKLSLRHLFAFVCLGCGGAETSSSDGTPTDADALVRGCDVYAQYCVDCHGPAAQGHGIHEQHLDPPPASLVDDAAIGKTDAVMRATIEQGGMNTGMPAYATVLSDSEVGDVMRFVRGLAADPSLSCTAGGADDDADPTTAADTAASGSDGAADSPGQGTGGASTGEPDATTGGGQTGSTTTGTDPSTDGDGASDSSGGPSGSPECEAYCGCVVPTCETEPGYPFADETACFDFCAERTAEELSCWMGFCDAVATSPGLELHLCEHAWGELGLNEC